MTCRLYSSESLQVTFNIKALKGSGLAAFGVVLLKGLMDLRGLSDFVPCGEGGEREGEGGRGGVGGKAKNSKGDSTLTTKCALRR